MFLVSSELYGHLSVNVITVPRSHVTVLVRVPAEVGWEVQASLLGVAYPALLVPSVCQVPAAHPLLELPEVTPQLEVLREEEEKPLNHIYVCVKILNTDLSISFQCNQLGVKSLTCSQGCPSALPTLNLRLTDTCSRLLMRLTAGGENRQRGFTQCS